MKKFGFWTCCLLAAVLLISKDVPVRAASPHHGEPGETMNRFQPQTGTPVPVRDRMVTAGRPVPRHSPHPQIPVPPPEPIVLRGQAPLPPPVSEPAPRAEKKSILSICLPHLSLSLDL